MVFKFKKFKIWFRIDKTQDATKFAFRGHREDEDMAFILGYKYVFFFEVYRFKSGFSILNDTSWQ